MSGLFGPQSYWVKDVEVWVKLPGHLEYLPVGALKRGSGSVSIGGLTYDAVEVFIEGAWNHVKRVKAAENSVTLRFELAETTAFTIPIVQGMDPLEDTEWNNTDRAIKISIGGKTYIPQIAVKLVAKDVNGQKRAEIFFHKCENVNGSEFNPTMTDLASFVWELQALPDYDDHNGEIYYWLMYVDSRDIINVTAAATGNSTTRLTIQQTTAFEKNGQLNYRFIALTTGGTGSMIPIGQARIISTCTASTTAPVIIVSSPWRNTTGNPTSPVLGDAFVIYVPATRIQEV